MKRFTFIRIVLLLVMATASLLNLHAQTEETHITSFGTYNFAGKHFCILSNMEHISSEDVEFKEYAKYISYAFQMRGGIEVPPESKEAEVCILMSYDIKDASYVRTVSEPVWGQTSVSSVTASKNFLGGTDYNYHYNYGVVSYRQSQQHVNSFNSYIDLFAYELSSNKNEQQKMVWKGYAKCNSHENNLFRLFPSMALTFYLTIGRTSEDDWSLCTGLVTNTLTNFFKAGDLCNKNWTHCPYIENGWDKRDALPLMKISNVYAPWIIQKNSSNTIVLMEARWNSLPGYGYWNLLYYRLFKNTYIQYNGQKYECQYAETLHGKRIKLGKMITAKGNEVWKGKTMFYLIFPPLPEDANVIDIISQKQKNSSSKDDIIWRGVHLRNW